jgi:DNA-binding transcriptional LysR family regulator
MALELIDLRTVSVAARLGSFSRAAEALNLTQPALSRRIAEVESTLGLALFERLPRGVRPTAACVAFLRHAEVALNSIENARNAALAVENRRVRDLAIGILENLCDQPMLSACRRALSGLDGAAINFRPRSLSAEISADLLADATRLGLRYGRDPDPQLEAMWIADDPIAIACAASHPLAGAAKATMDDLERAQWIGSSARVDHVTGRSPEDMPAAVFRGWSAMQSAPIFAKLQLLEAGLGLAMVRSACIREQAARGVVVVLDTPLSLSIPIFLTWRRGADLGDAGERFRDQLRSVYAPTAL